MRYLLAALTVLAFALVAEAAPQWFVYRGDENYYYLYEGEVLVGAFDLHTRVFRPIDPRTGVVGLPCQPPVSLPGEGVSNYGIDQSRIGRRERFTRDGVEISQEDALRSLHEGQNPTIPADQNQLRVTVIGPQADTERVRTDLQSHAALATFRGQVVTNFFTPDHWAVQCGFVASGRPTIYIQAPDGTVLHRQDDYVDGPEGLALALAEARRRVDPNYQPVNDHDLRKNKFLNFLSQIPLEVLLIVGGLLMFVFLPQRK